MTAREPPLIASFSADAKTDSPQLCVRLFDHQSRLIVFRLAIKDAEHLAWRLKQLATELRNRT